MQSSWKIHVHIIQRRVLWAKRVNVVIADSMVLTGRERNSSKKGHLALCITHFIIAFYSSHLILAKIWTSLIVYTWNKYLVIKIYRVVMCSRPPRWLLWSIIPVQCFNMSYHIVALQKENFFSWLSLEVVSTLYLYFITSFSTGHFAFIYFCHIRWTCARVCLCVWGKSITCISPAINQRNSCDNISKY